MSHSPDTLKLTVAYRLADQSTIDRLLAERPGLVQSLSIDERGQVAEGARDENVSAVRLMLGAGWPVDARGEDLGGSALHWAAWHGSTDLMRTILEFSPPLELEDTQHHGTPLGWAFHGSLYGWRKNTGDYAGVVEMLLAAGARVRSGEINASPAVRAVLERRGIVV